MSDLSAGCCAWLNLLPARLVGIPWESPFQASWAVLLPHAWASRQDSDQHWSQKRNVSRVSFSGSPWWPHLVELWEPSRLLNPPSQEENWLPHDQICLIQVSEVSWVNFSSFLFEGICFTSQLMLRTRISHNNLLSRIFYRIYFLCFLLHSLPFTKKTCSASLPSFLRITPFPLWFKNLTRFLPAFEMCFCKKASVYINLHN